MELSRVSLQPFYGGKLHHVTSEVKNPAGEIVARMNGEWNGQMELSYANVRIILHLKFLISVRFYYHLNVKLCHCLGILHFLMQSMQRYILYTVLIWSTENFTLQPWVFSGRYGQKNILTSL